MPQGAGGEHLQFDKFFHEHKLQMGAERFHEGDYLLIASGVARRKYEIKKMQRMQCLYSK